MLGLPTRGDSTLPESDRIDELTHSSPADVDDRPGASPTSLKLYKHGIAPGDTVRVLLGKGKHSDKITTATSVTVKEIVTPLGSFKPSALVKYIDRTTEMKALGIVPGVIVETNDGTKAEVICTFADGRVLASGRYYRYSELTVLEPESAEVEESALDEMWSYVGKKTNPRWLWHAIDRKTGQVERLCFWKAKRQSLWPASRITKTIWY